MTKLIDIGKYQFQIISATGHLVSVALAVVDHHSLMAGCICLFVLISSMNAASSFRTSA